MIVKKQLVRKTLNVETWFEECSGYRERDLFVERVIDMPDKYFRAICSDFFAYRNIIRINKDCMFYENGIDHVLALTSNKSDIVLLVQSEGCDYCRYTSVMKKKEFELLKGENCE